MGLMNEPDVVRKQYQNSEKLSIRINLHRKYSTNKEGFGNWTFRQYPDLSEKDVLELGCGTGELWKGRNDTVQKMGSLVLSDISEGMIRASKENIGSSGNIDYLVFNAETVPFGDGSFDYVIANHMLYHVPDLEKVLGEIKRILKPDGILFATTFGEEGILKYINSLTDDLIPAGTVKSSFTLQNGEGVLKKNFTRVSCRNYIDSLRITEEEDLLDYIFSMSNFMAEGIDEREILHRKLRDIKEKKGIIEIHKEAGMFIASE